jgi:2-amino-4-hydroxy-6-hydroxymethyldihydropteridine diphosphokinase
MTLAVVSLGGNVGDVSAAFDFANRQLQANARIDELRTASIYQSVPMGQQAGDTFSNSVTAFQTSLEPLELLDELQQLEDAAGRTRDIHWGPRTLDLDLILFGDRIVDHDRLQVPHPHFFYRRFVIEPAATIVPDVVDPVSGQTIAEFQRRLLRRPFRILLGDGISIEPIREEFRTEFPAVEFEPFNARRESSDSGLGLCLSDSGVGSSSRDRFWLELQAQDHIAEIRWILQAAGV